MGDWLYPTARCTDRLWASGGRNCYTSDSFFFLNLSNLTSEQALETVDNEGSVQTVQDFNRTE